MPLSMIGEGETATITRIGGKEEVFLRISDS